MSVYDEIIGALNSGDNNAPILKFDKYQIVGNLGKGEQGIVVKVENKIGRSFALKICRPIHSGTKETEKAISNFIREVNILVNLYHKNIVKICTGGNAIWDKEQKAWTVEDSFRSTYTQEEGLFYYYIMDYIDNGIESIFPELNQEQKVLLAISERGKLFEGLMTQICEGMQYYHNKGITHKDIRYRNIRYSKDDSTFIIVDFGFARHTTSEPSSSDRPRLEDMRDAASFIVGDFIKNDIAHFCQLLYKVLPSLKGVYSDQQYRGLDIAIKKGFLPRLEDRYINAQKLFEAVKPYFRFSPAWNMNMKLGEFITSKGFGRFTRKLRIPVSGSVLVSEEVLNIIDTPEFQRLRGVRQLGPTMFVFPGANHTRFEHSLGAYSLASRYVDRLVMIPEFAELCNPVDESIKMVLLVALLHDIGHYPYSHWIEEIDSFEGGIKFSAHEERARDFLCSKGLMDVIKGEWGLNPETVADVIASKNLNNPVSVLANSFVDSVIDVDKLDYLIRDSIHCGVDYGKGIDIERLLDSLYVDIGNKKICFSEKGRSLLLSMISCRNIMYQEVYWHKTVRACDAMFKRFFYEYVKVNRGQVDEIKKWFDLCDDDFIKRLYAECSQKENLRKLIAPFIFKGRELYKPAYVFTQGYGKEPENTQRFFRKVLDLRNYQEIVKISEDLTKQLKIYCPKAKIDPLDIIVESTPVRNNEKYKLQNFQLWNGRKKRFESYPRELDTLNEYLEHNRQAYIFCSPVYYDFFKNLTSQNKLDEILAKI